MGEEKTTSREELDDLKNEIERFKRDQERVKNIIGKIGGVPTFHTKLFNIIFAVFVVGCLVISLLSGGTLRLAMIELAIAVLSLKIIFLIHNQARVNHFQLWILSSLEWRFNELVKEIRAKKTGPQ